MLGGWVGAGWSSGLTVDAARNRPDGQRSPTGPLTGACTIGFGRHGKPCHVLRPLDRTVGQANYHFLVGVDAFESA